MKQLLQEQRLKLMAEKGWNKHHPLLPLLLCLRVLNLLWRWLRARWTFRRAAALGNLIFQNGSLKLRQEGSLRIGNRVRFWSTIVPAHVRIGPGAALEIADNCYINGSIIAAHESIRIDKGVYLAPMAHISDSYAFGTPEASLNTAAIHIKENAWIATRAVILPGLTIGRGAVVAVGAMVTADVPDRALVGGVPAKVIRYLEPNDTVDTIPEASLDPENPSKE